MKYCIHCGNALEDHANFCNVCGNNQQAAQQPVYQQPVYQTVYQQPVTAAPFKAPVWVIGLFVFLGYILVRILSGVISTVLATAGIAIGVGIVNTLMVIVYHILFALFVVLGISVYNSKCRKAAHPEKKLSALWSGIPLALRIIFSFVSSFLIGSLISLWGYNAGFGTMQLGMAIMIYNMVSVVLFALLNWLISCAIFKGIVKNR